ncbi:hypothetical protein ACWCYZ_28470 [Streptomyces virginiae]
MNDPITLAAKQHEDRHGTPDPIAPDEPTTPPMRTLVETAATCRPVEEVTALVSLLKEGGPLPDAGHDALRTAAVTRPVQDVRRMVALLGESPHEVAEADLTLRAAAVGRSIEDVALLVTILGKEDAAETERRGRAGPPVRPRRTPPRSRSPPLSPRRSGTRHRTNRATRSCTTPRTRRRPGAPLPPTRPPPPATGRRGASCAGPSRSPCWSAAPCTCRTT